MNAFTEQTPAGQLLRAGRRTLAMGQAHPPAKAVVAPFVATQNRLKAAMNAANEGDDALIDALAAVDLVRELVLSTLALADADLLATTPFSEAAGLPAEALLSTLPALAEAARAQPTGTALATELTQYAARAIAPLETLARVRQKALAVQGSLAKARAAWLEGYAALQEAFGVAFPGDPRLRAAFFP